MTVIPNYLISCEFVRKFIYLKSRSSTPHRNLLFFVFVFLSPCIYMCVCKIKYEYFNSHMCIPMCVYVRTLHRRAGDQLKETLWVIKKSKEKDFYSLKKGIDSRPPFLPSYISTSFIISLPPSILPSLPPSLLLTYPSTSSYLPSLILPLIHKFTSNLLSDNLIRHLVANFSRCTKYNQ